MTNENDNAFSGPTNDGYQDGLTKREYFAAMAMQGLMANTKFYAIAIDKLSPDEIGDFYALVATEQADALIQELNKKQ